MTPAHTATVADEQRFLVARLHRRQQAPPCLTHPAHRDGYCQPCLDHHHATALERARQTAIAAAQRGCDQRLPARYRHVTPDHPDVLAWLDRYHRDPATAGGLLLMGATGTGKTHQAYGALRAAATTHPTYQPAHDHWHLPDWEATTTADLAAAMRPNTGNHHPEAVLRRNRTVDLLLLDDLGIDRTTSWAEEHLYRLINSRYEQLSPTICTTNLNPEQLRNALGDRITSRLAHTNTKIILTGPDRRRTASRATID